MPIRRRGNSYQVDILDAQGKRVRRSFPTRTAAREWESAGLAAVEAGEPLPSLGQGNTFVAADRISIAQAVASCYTHVWSTQKSGEHSRANAERAAAILGDYRPVASVAGADMLTLRGTLLKRGLSAARVNRYMAAMSRVFTHARSVGWMTHSPAIPLSKESPGRIRYLSHEEEQSLTGWFTKQGRSDLTEYVQWACDTGLRTSETVGIGWEDVNLTPGEAFVTSWVNKADLPRTIPLTDRAFNILKTRRDRGDIVPFGEDYGTAKTRSPWSRAKTALGWAADKELTPHALRHTFCTRLALLGVDVLRIKTLAGHRSIETTMRYIHLRSEHTTEAIQTLSRSITSDKM